MRISSQSMPVAKQSSKLRYLVLGMLFVVTAINYADRATLSIAGSALSADLGIDAVTMGYLFSAFGWSYVIAQVPGGMLLDRFGSRNVYFVSIVFWSIFTLLQGAVNLISLSTIATVYILFALRFLVGFAEAPSFPANSRVVTSWFPAKERGTASAIFNSAQYFSTVIFAPIMAWMVHHYGWPSVFYFMGGLGVIVGFVWLKVIYEPANHPKISESELAYIENRNINSQPDELVNGKSSVSKWTQIKQLLSSRMLLGIFIGQYAITTLTYFFLTWFPVYLVKDRGFSILNAGIVASLPAICGFLGGILGGYISDSLIKRGNTISLSRKVPIVVGMLLSTSIVICNYVDSAAIVVGVMSLAFFGKGIGALGWAVVSDTSPKEGAGLSAGLFNTFGNTAGITTPIVIGYLIQGTGSFNAALGFVAANAVLAIVCYVIIVGQISRFAFKKQ